MTVRVYQRPAISAEQPEGRYHKCGDKIDVTPEPNTLQKNGAPTRELADRTSIRNVLESGYLRIFKSNVYVRDHDRSLKFYVDQLGFSLLADARFEFGRWAAVAPPAGSAILALLA